MASASSKSARPVTKHKRTLQVENSAFSRRSPDGPRASDKLFIHLNRRVEWFILGGLLSIGRREGTLGRGQRRRQSASIERDDAPIYKSTSSSDFGARSEMKAKRASGFEPIRRSTVSAVASFSSAMTATRKSVRFAGSIVVSRKSRIGISPSPLNRLTSIAPRPENPDF